MVAFAWTVVWILIGPSVCCVLRVGCFRCRFFEWIFWEIFLTTFHVAVLFWFVVVVCWLFFTQTFVSLVGLGGWVGDVVASSFALLLSCLLWH